VEIRRRLAQDNPARFASDLALSLNNLSNCLSDAGDRAGALAATRETVDIYRRLAQDDPTRFAPNLAGNLTNLAVFLNNSGDGAGGLAVGREATDIYRRLAQDDPMRFGPNLGRSLNHLSVLLGDAGNAAASARAAMMLPMAKTFCAEAAVLNADAAIQVLGGAGYVKEWPVERMLRDARVFAIYEGTTAIQGIDLLQRRVLSHGGDSVVADLIHHLAPASELAAQLTPLIESLARAPARAAEAAAVPFLRLLALVVSDGLLRRAGERAGPLAGRYAALADFHAVEARRKAALLVDRCRHDDLDAAFDAAFAA